MGDRIPADRLDSLRAENEFNSGVARLHPAELVALVDMAAEAEQLRALVRTLWQAAYDDGFEHEIDIQYDDLLRRVLAGDP